MDRLTATHLAQSLAHAIETAGIGIMVLGGAGAALAFALRLLQRRTTGPPFEQTYRDLRADLGRAILLGLEFLVAADIIGTVAVEPTFQSLGVLALIVVVRTFLSFTLELEISGRWPWQHVEAEGAPGRSRDAAVEARMHARVER